MAGKLVQITALIAIAGILASAMGTTSFAWSGTGFFSLLVAIEAVILVLILGAPWPFPPRGRAVVAMLLFMVVLWYSAQDTLGAPGYVFVHQVWLVGIILSCLLRALWRRR